LLPLRRGKQLLLPQLGIAALVRLPGPEALLDVSPVLDGPARSRAVLPKARAIAAADPAQESISTLVETADGCKPRIPHGTHILLDVWRANRHEDHWGVGATGFPAAEFAPERWQRVREQWRGSKELLHFGFGHGSRVCPRKHMGQLETALIVGAFVYRGSFREAFSIQRCHFPQRTQGRRLDKAGRRHAG
jgi:hypothetical protein